jgi:hypothetical protein
MALRTDGAEEIISDKSTSHGGIDDVSKTPPATGDPDVETDLSIEGLSDAAALPKGTLDPVYEAKARVLNHAVGTSGRGHARNTDGGNRSKKLEWAGINGSSSSSLVSVGQTTIYGPL